MLSIPVPPYGILIEQTHLHSTVPKDMKIPWSPTIKPRVLGGDTSLWNSGTAANNDPDTVLVLCDIAASLGSQGSLTNTKACQKPRDNEHGNVYRSSL